MITPITGHRALCVCLTVIYDQVCRVYKKQKKDDENETTRSHEANVNPGILTTLTLYVTNVEYVVPATIETDAQQLGYVEQIS